MLFYASAIKYNKYEIAINRSSSISRVLDNQKQVRQCAIEITFIYRFY